jgi:membrane fusion protein, heavy metal efflux system
MPLQGLPRPAATRYLLDGAVAVAALVGAVRIFDLPARLGLVSTTASAAPSDQSPPALTQQSTAEPAAAPSVELTKEQLQSFKIEAVASHVFPIQDQAVGSIDFDEDMESQIFTPYQGRIVALFAKVGDDVEKGQTLFTIDSPDLIQAESTLISTAAVLQLTTKALARARGLLAANGGALKDVEQATSDEQSAEANYKAAMDAVRIFGKTSAQIDKIAQTRQIDSILVVPSPISGRVTARNAAPGLFVQPGNAPAPFTVADISKMWMIANIPEIDTSCIKVGQPVQVTLMAYPGQTFDGDITTLGATVDPVLHTLLVRSEINDPRHQLRPGMFADFIITTGDPVSALAVPVNAVVREGDGTMTVWVTTDRQKFTQREVKVGLQHNGYDQITDGLRPGELVVSDGAVFLDNMLTASPTD